MGERRAAFDAAALIRARGPALALFAVWLCLVALGLSHHVFWRDEVRALSLALQGDSVTGFFRAIHGEGHPALWYILLRGAYLLFHSPMVLPAVSVIIAVAAMLILVLRAPFRWPLIGLILFSHFALSEYSVIARNYGVSMLMMFAFAALYERHRRGGVVLGALLFLLANCNVHSVILAGGFLLLWFVDIVQETGLRWTAQARVFVLNAAIAAAGVIVCALTVFPTFNDAGIRAASISHPALKALSVIIDPAAQFYELAARPATFSGLAGMSLLFAILALLSTALFLAPAGLIRRPGAALAGLLTLISLSLFFAFGVVSDYRHEALWLVFMIALYWISAERSDDAAQPAPAGLVSLLTRVGRIAFVGLLAMQAVLGLFDVFDAVHPGPPRSRVGDLARLIESRSDLRAATVIADPDDLVEALAYYTANPLYLMREHRFGSVVRFTRRAQLFLSLGDVLADAQRLRAQTGRPVVILLATRLDQLAPNTPVMEGYDWLFTATPAQVQAFEAATVRLARMGPATTDETFDVYELR